MAFKEIGSSFNLAVIFGAMILNSIVTFVIACVCVRAHLRTHTHVQEQIGDWS